MIIRNNLYQIVNFINGVADAHARTVGYHIIYIPTIFIFIFILFIICISIQYLGTMFHHWSFAGQEGIFRHLVPAKRLWSTSRSSFLPSTAPNMGHRRPANFASRRKSFWIAKFLWGAKFARILSAPTWQRSRCAIQWPARRRGWFGKTLPCTGNYFLFIFFTFFLNDFWSRL